jgi:hypothetical protein
MLKKVAWYEYCSKFPGVLFIFSRVYGGEGEKDGRQL